MGDINFYLKEPKSTKKSLIVLQFKYMGRGRLVHSFGESIEPSNWNFEKQRVKKTNQTTKDGQYKLNELLDHLAAVLEAAYNAEKIKGFPSEQVLKKYLINARATKEKDPSAPTLYSVIERLISRDIGNAISDRTISNYKGGLKHLKKFEDECNYKVDFETITLDFHYKYTNFLEKKIGLIPNTIRKEVKLVKLFMGEAVDLGFTKNFEFKNKKFTFKGEDRESVYLTDMEIMRLYKHNFKTQRHQEVRDLFIIACCSGLRFSDFSNIEDYNIIKSSDGRMIQLRTKKTKDKLIIPCHPMTVEILERYPKGLPIQRTVQDFNKAIKEACKICGLDQKGRIVDNPEKELCELVSTHTGRRSFATNNYKRGISIVLIMKMTGHKSEKSFFGYIKINKEEAAVQFREENKVNWDEISKEINAEKLELEAD